MASEHETEADYYRTLYEATKARLTEAERLLLEWADNTDTTFAALGGKPGPMSRATRAFLRGESNV
jgi:hypothetical protein